MRKRKQRNRAPMPPLRPLRAHRSTAAASQHVRWRITASGRQRAALACSKPAQPPSHVLTVPQTGRRDWPRASAPCNCSCATRAAE